MKRVILIILALLVVVGGFLIIKKRKKPLEITISKVSYGELILKVRARGKIEAKDRYEVYAKIPGVLEFIKDEGERVKKGEIIAIIDDKELLVRKKEAERNLTAFQNTLNFLERAFDIESLRKKVDETRIVFNEQERLFLGCEKLFQENAISEDEFKRIKAEYDRLKLNLELSIREVKERELKQKEDIEASLKNIEAIKASLLFIDQQIAWAKVSSPIDGIIIHKLIKEDIYIPPGGMLLLVLASPDEFVVKIELDETDIAKVSLGMPSLIFPDAFPSKSISGVITKIAPSPILKQKINIFEVTIALNKTSLPIRSEMLGDVVITSAKKENVLKIPIEAIVQIDDKDYIYVIRDNRAIKKEIVLGLRTPNDVEIISGLSKGEMVILNPSLDLEDGTKIKIKKNAH